MVYWRGLDISKLSTNLESLSPGLKDVTLVNTLCNTWIFIFLWQRGNWEKMALLFLSSILQFPYSVKKAVLKLVLIPHDLVILP
jgi:hypothetical protein